MAESTTACQNYRCRDCGRQFVQDPQNKPIDQATKNLIDMVQVKQALSVPIVAVVSDGQQSIRKAVAAALPEAAHGLCQFHYLREAAKQIYDADRHAKKELKKRVRGIRTIERERER